MLINTTKLNAAQMTIAKALFAKISTPTATRDELRKLNLAMFDKLWAPSFIVKNDAFKTDKRGIYRLPAKLGGPKGLKSKVVVATKSDDAVVTAQTTQNSEPALPAKKTATKKARKVAAKKEVTLEATAEMLNSATTATQNTEATV